MMVGIALTVLALGLLGLRACTGSPADQAPSTTGPAPTTTQEAPAVSVSTSSIAVLPDWYPKQVSRYSERETVVTVSTLPPTSSTSTTGAPRSTQRPTGGD